MLHVVGIVRGFKLAGNHLNRKVAGERRKTHTGAHTLHRLFIRNGGRGLRTPISKPGVDEA